LNSNKALATFFGEDLMKFELFVFDLDFTIWDAGGSWCDCTNPPYFWKDGKLLDQSNLWIRLYPDVKDILERLKSEGKIIVAASRTFEPDWANDLLKLLDINKYFDLKEIYPSNKIKHFKRIQNHFQLPFSKMIFFDDEYRNIEEVGQLGVKAVFVRNGINLKMVEEFM
jgi:magnesium-dependent phosphatase 1